MFLTTLSYIMYPFISHSVAFSTDKRAQRCASRVTSCVFVMLFILDANCCVSIHIHIALRYPISYATKQITCTREWCTANASKSVFFDKADSQWIWTTQWVFLYGEEKRQVCPKYLLLLLSSDAQSRHGLLKRTVCCVAGLYRVLKLTEW